MDSKEADFTAKLLAIFKLEAEEHLKMLSNGLLALEGTGSDEQKKEWIETIYRESHSLKGAARSVNHDAIQVICQTMENVLSAWKQGKISPTRPLFDTLYAVIDFIGTVVAMPPKGLPEEHRGRQLALIQQLDALLSGSPAPVATPTPTPAPPSKEPAHPPEPAVVTPPSEKTVRISVQKVDKLFQQVEEMLVVKLTARKQINELKYMQSELRQWDKRWEHLQQEQSAKGITEWQRQFSQFVKAGINRLTKLGSQDYRFVGSLIDNLLEDTKKVLTQPFQTLFESFPRMVRDLSQSLGKEIHLEFKGGEIEIDRRILEEMKDPLIHLIRNAIDHGIETPNERVQKGKPSYGTIAIAASQVSGNNIELTLSDDGVGIDVESVKNFALQKGYITKEEAEHLNEQEAIALIFHSGISTSAKVTELSGRGLGMGIIAEKVEKLGGHLFTETKKGQGTQFRIVLPLTLATFRGIHIRASERDFIMPIQYIKHVMRLPIREIKTVENRMAIVADGKLLPFVHLSDLLSLPSQTQAAVRKNINILIIKAAEKVIAIGVDEVLSEQEILVKPLGKQLLHVRNILAATVLEGGKVVPILHPMDLVRSAIQGASSSQSLSLRAEPIKKKVVLVVEDSITARTLLKNILLGAGYEVRLASDGVEALAVLQAEKIDLILSDVEMPHMDGFVLTSKVREMESWRNIPIILCTALGSAEDRKRGMDVGANAYVDKSSFMQSDLLTIMQKLL